MALNFFNTSKKHVRQFSIPYRFHDPAKERSDERESRIKGELQAEQEDKNQGEYKSAIKGSFRRSRGSMSAQRSGKSSNFVKVLLLIFILSMFAYFFLR